METYTSTSVAPVPNPPAYKVILLGDLSVGKSSLIRRGADANLLFDAIPEKLITVDGANVRLLLYDLAPDQARYREVREQFYQGALAAALVFDMSSPSSFFNLMHWRDEMQSFVPLLPGIVVGNKCDQFQVIPVEEVRGWAESLSMPFMLTSAETGEGVDQLWIELARLASQERQRREERQRAMRWIIR
ncbi:MAG: Rab family GTPase [Anaerolineae bacterium]|nr:GTP-binding protein [Anaerolineae bacterium]